MNKSEKLKDIREQQRKIYHKLPTKVDITVGRRTNDQVADYETYRRLRREEEEIEKYD